MIHLRIEPSVVERFSRSFLRRYHRIIQPGNFKLAGPDVAAERVVVICRPATLGHWLQQDNQLQASWYIIDGNPSDSDLHQSHLAKSGKLLWSNCGGGSDLERLVEGVINQQKEEEVASLKAQAWENRERIDQSGHQLYLQTLKGELDQTSKVLEAVIELFAQANTITKLSELCDLINQFQSDFSLWGEVVFLSPLDIHHPSLVDRECITPYLLYSASSKEEEHYLCWCGDDQVVEEAEQPQDLLVRWLILKVVESYFYYLEKLLPGSEFPVDLSLVLSRLELPVALISEQGELLLQNDHFLSLAIFPGECLDLLDGARVERKSVVYKVGRKEITTPQGTIFSFVFTSSNSKERRPPTISSSELGIISSSIAHELNNPLAGMLAAITLLLDDDWEASTKESLLEMRSSATRCKRLVEIFLGFSRSSPLSESEQDMLNSFEQAMDLLRFRMIESNCFFDFEKEVVTQFQRSVNGSVTTMIFYLLFNQLITALSHQTLITGESASAVGRGLGVEGVITQQSDELTISLFYASELLLSLEQTKLVNYLLELEGLTLETLCCEGGRMEFRLS
jgi:hypothetical protein